MKQGSQEHYFNYQQIRKLSSTNNLYSTDTISLYPPTHITHALMHTSYPPHTHHTRANAHVDDEMDIAC